MHVVGRNCGIVTGIPHHNAGNLSYQFTPNLHNSMLPVDIPSRAELEKLIEVRSPACLSVYLPTSPLTQESQHDRLVFKNQIREGREKLEAAGAGADAIKAIVEALEDIEDDGEFWRYQAHSLAVLATPERILSYRLPHALNARVVAGDRFLVKPLLRAITTPRTAFVLALSQNGVRLVEVTGDLPAVEIQVPGLPADAASAAGKASILGREPKGRIQGSEGQKVRLGMFSRQIDRALRDVLNGSDLPLILAAVQPLDAIYRSINSYPHLVAESIGGNSDETTDAELADASRAILDRLHDQELRKLHELFGQRSNEGRATTDVAHAARAATFGAIGTLLVDIDDEETGVVNADGSVELGTGSHGLVDQIAALALASGARVLGERRADIPGGGSLAAILRYPF